MITLLPDLPPDVSENILQSLTCKDVCNLAQSCKAFWALTCQQQSIEFRAGSDLSVLSKAKSLSRYLQNRGARGLQVQNLYIVLDGRRSVPVCIVLAEIIRACSKSLRRLSLHNVVLEYFSPTTGPFLVALKDCKRLACLTITLSSHYGTLCEDDGFLQDILPALPQLNALQVMPFTVEAEAKLVEDCLVPTAGATQEAGLQLLAMQLSKSPLPASLRCLFLRSRDISTEGLALAHLSHLQELYVTCLQRDQYSYLMQHGLAAVRHSLRALVLDYIKRPLEEGDVVPLLDMPRLQLFAMPNMHPVIAGNTLRSPALHLRCPQLKVFACEIPVAKDALSLLHLVREGAPQLQTLQVSLACEGGNERNLEAYGAMWRSLKGAHCLQNLHVVLRSIHIAEVDKQVNSMLKAAMEVEGLCLPKLSVFNIYLRCTRVPRHMQDALPGLVVGVPFQGTLAVTVTLRDFVAKGIMPALTQVGMHPCRQAKTNSLHGQLAKYYGPLPHMVSMPQVKWVAISKPGHMLEHPDWTGADQEMLQRALVAMTRCRRLNETLGRWDYRRPAPAHDAAIDYEEIDFEADDEDDEGFYFAHLGHLIGEVGYDPFIDDYDAPEFADDEDAYGQHADFFFLPG